MKTLRKKIVLTITLCLAIGLVAAGTAPAFQVGDLKVGGAMRVNYTFGDYDNDITNGSATRDPKDGGLVSLDTFRINLDYLKGAWQAKVEYRFYPGYSGNDGYHFLHTGWVGYNFGEAAQLQVGVNRVPFGAGPYGVSQSFFFDQNYYVGLADDMDLGAKYTRTMGNLKFDVAYYFMDEGSWVGGTEDSTRYSYDVVDETGDGYEERHQVNLRGIYTAGKTALGASVQYGQLKSNGEQDDGSLFAGAVHAVPKFGNLTLAMQVTYYSYDVDEDQPGGTDKLVSLGAFDFPTMVAAEAWIPAVSLSYRIDTNSIDWLDYILPYIEYSSIMKQESDFNDSQMFTMGAAWANGGWYIYSDLVYSNGNDFIGNKSGYGDVPAGSGAWSNRFGANPTDSWEYRFNINFGYYF